MTRIRTAAVDTSLQYREFNIHPGRLSSKHNSHSGTVKGTNSMATSFLWYLTSCWQLPSAPGPKNIQVKLHTHTPPKKKNKRNRGEPNSLWEAVLIGKICGAKFVHHPNIPTWLRAQKKPFLIQDLTVKCWGNILTRRTTEIVRFLYGRLNRSTLYPENICLVVFLVLR